MKKNILFIGRSKNQFSYIETIIYYLVKTNKYNITLSFDKEWSILSPSYALDKFVEKNKDIKVEWAPRRDDIYRNIIFFLREVKTYASYLRRKDQSVFYTKRWLKYLPKPLRILLKFSFFRRIISSKIIYKALIKIEEYIPPCEKINKYILEKSPDLIISSPTNLRYSEAIEYIKSAKYLGIKTYVPVYSWDNLTTKSLIHIKPDKLFVWNISNKKEAIQIHSIPRENIVISGSAFFDKWLNNNLLIEEKKFKLDLGLKNEEKYLLYLGSSGNISKNETWVIENIYNKLKNKRIDYFKNLKIIVRTHPSNYKVFQELQKNNEVKFKIFPEDFNLPEVLESQKTFYSSVYYSEAVVGINTSAMIDSIIMNKPTIAFLNKQFKGTQSKARHFKYLAKSKALYTTNTIENLLSLIYRINNIKDYKEIDRSKFVSEFIRPNGIDASVGKFIAKYITKEI